MDFAWHGGLLRWMRRELRMERWFLGMALALAAPAFAQAAEPAEGAASSCEAEEAALEHDMDLARSRGQMLRRRQLAENLDALRARCRASEPPQAARRASTSWSTTSARCGPSSNMPRRSCASSRTNGPDGRAGPRQSLGSCMRRRRAASSWRASSTSRSTLPRSTGPVSRACVPLSTDSTRSRPRSYRCQISSP